MRGHRGLWAFMALTGSLLFVISCSEGGEGAVSGECSDEIDNDQDGAIDCEDEGCVGDLDCFGSGDDDDAADDDDASDDDDSGSDDDDSGSDDDDSGSDDDDSGSDDDDSGSDDDDSASDDDDSA